MAGAHPRPAIVTGADSGLGSATAELSASEGFDAGLTYHTDEAGAADTGSVSRSVGSAAGLRTSPAPRSPSTAGSA